MDACVGDRPHGLQVEQRRLADVAGEVVGRLGLLPLRSRQPCVCQECAVRLSDGYLDGLRGGLLERVQERVDAVPEGQFDATLIGFGLCEKILPGLAARSMPLVTTIARACPPILLSASTCS